MTDSESNSSEKKKTGGKGFFRFSSGGGSGLFRRSQNKSDTKNLLDSSSSSSSSGCASAYTGAHVHIDPERHIRSQDEPNKALEIPLYKPKQEDEEESEEADGSSGDDENDEDRDGDDNLDKIEKDELSYNEELEWVYSIPVDDSVAVKVAEQFVYRPSFFVSDCVEDLQEVVEMNAKMTWDQCLSLKRPFQLKWPKPRYAPTVAQVYDVVFCLPEEYRSLSSLHSQLKNPGTHIDISFSLQSLIHKVCPSGVILPLNITIVKETSTLPLWMSAELRSPNLTKPDKWVDWMVNKAGCSATGHELVSHIITEGENTSGINRILFKALNNINLAVFSRLATVDKASVMSSIHLATTSPDEPGFILFRAPDVGSKDVFFDTFELITSIIIWRWNQICALSKKMNHTYPRWENRKIPGEKIEKNFFVVSKHVLEIVVEDLFTAVDIGHRAMDTSQLTLRMKPIRTSDVAHLGSTAKNFSDNYVEGMHYHSVSRPDYLLRLRMTCLPLDYPKAKKKDTAIA